MTHRPPRLRHKTILALVLCCLTMGAYFPICARMFNRAPDSSPPTNDVQFDEGRRVFSELGCHACHAREGRGGKTGPDLDALAAPENRARIVEGITNPPQTPSERYGAVMPAGLTQNLSEAEFEALVYYLTTPAPN